MINSAQYRENAAFRRGRTLFLSAGCFGALGGTIAMHLFHHKTNHWNFKSFFPAMMIIQIVILGFVVYKWVL